MKKILLTLAFAMPLIGFSQWEKTNLGNSQVKEGKLNIESNVYFKLNEEQIKQNLANAPERFSNLPGVIVSIPNAQGKMEQFEVWESSNFAPELQAKFPEIRSYVGIGIDDPSAYLRFSVSPAGISTMKLKGGKSEFIEKHTQDGKYIVYDSKKHRDKSQMPFECSTPEEVSLFNDAQDVVGMTGKSSAGVFKTFRLAMSCTGEYGTYHGGTVAGAMAGINATMTRVNGVFEKDLAVRLILIPNNDLVVYTNASTDPYSPPSGMDNWSNQLQTTLNSIIGLDNYDIGHLFGRSGGGGNAGCIGCVCLSNKGRGYTSPGQGGPEGDFFDIDYVAHELGHQLGANHTFSHGVEGTGVNIEPGSGSTIMGYAGITSYNVQQHSDDYFTYRSILQIQNNIQNKPCAVNTTLTNQAPQVNAGDDYYIPFGTAFVLRGTATDPNNDPLEFIWEQNDNATGNNTGANSRVSFTKTTGPNFRSKPYVNEPVRYMPAFDFVLSQPVNENENYWRQKWEAVTNVARTFNFTLTARDNNVEGGQTGTDAMRVTVVNAGPFKVTSPASGANVDLSTNTMEVTWDVAGTNAGQINTQNVRILLSTDNGANFTVVAESTPNDGSEVVTIPAGTVAGSNNRIMIEAIDNIYYAVTPKFNFTGTMGVADMNNSFNIGLYPNPSNGQFTIQSGNVAKGDVKTSIFDASGKLVYSSTKNHNGGALNQNYNVKLPAGVYVVTLETTEGKSNTKLIIK